MKVFIIGIAGGVGRRLAQRLVERGDEVSGLVRDRGKVEELARGGIHATPGDLVAMTVPELAAVLRGSDAVVFSAGAGGKDGPEATRRVDGEGPPKLAAAAQMAGVRRFVLVSVFPEAWRERERTEDFEHYMREKKKADAQVVLTDLDWVLIRPAALIDEPGTGRVDLGLAKIHHEISRDDVATTIVEVLGEPGVGRTILEVTAGTTPIRDAVAAMRR